jgi:hypothetical protein
VDWALMIRLWSHQWDKGLDGAGKNLVNYILSLNILTCRTPAVSSKKKVLRFGNTLLWWPQLSDHHVVCPALHLNATAGIPLSYAQKNVLFPQGNTFILYAREVNNWQS